MGWAYGRNGDNGVVDLLTQIAFGDLLHLSKDHGGNFLRGERTVLAVDFHGNRRLLITVGDPEREVLNIGLDVFVGPFAANQSPAHAH